MHEHKCNKCGKIATKNYQHCWVSWDITEDGNFVNSKFHDVDDNEFYCDDCWDKLIWGEEEEVNIEPSTQDNPVFRLGYGSISDAFFGSEDIKPTGKKYDDKSI